MKFECDFVRYYNSYLGSPKGVLVGDAAKQFLLSEKANPKNKHFWGNAESRRDAATVFDGSEEVEKFRRGEAIDHFAPFVNHANKGSENVGSVWLKVTSIVLMSNYNFLIDGREDGPKNTTVSPFVCDLEAGDGWRILTSCLSREQ